MGAAGYIAGRAGQASGFLDRIDKIAANVDLVVDLTVGKSLIVDPAVPTADVLGGGRFFRRGW